MCTLVQNLKEKILWRPAVTLVYQLIELMKIHYLNTLTDIFQFDIVGSCNVPNSVQYILITPRPATVRLAELLHYCLAQFSTLNLLQ